LWINSIGLRKPTLHGKDIAKIGAKLNKFFKGHVRVKENIDVISPLVIPLHSNRLARKINRLLLLKQVIYYQNRFKYTDPILWTFLPNVDFLLGAFNEKLSVYHITDDFTQFTGYPSESIMAMERELINNCDVIIASAQNLADKKAFDGKEINVVSHGVEHDVFSGALRMSRDEWPRDIRDKTRPIIGFYGEINDWLDLEMLARAAKKRPEWSFVLIGRIAMEVGNIDYLLDISNVHWLGQKNYKQLPAYCSAFDVALIPMKINELTLNVNPLKLREYLAAGVPVVSASLPEVKPYRDIVEFADNHEDLIAKIEILLKRDRLQSAPLLSERVANESWDSKVENVSEIIERAINTMRL